MIAESLTRNLDHQLAKAPELRNLAYSVVVAEHKQRFTRPQRLALLIFYRSLQTHEAVEVLIRRQIVEDARILERVLVEHSVNCAYMLTVADDNAADDFLYYPKYWRHKILAVLKHTDESRLRRSVSIELEKEVRMESDSLQSRFKGRRNGEWCADGQLHRRAAKVDEKLGINLELPSYAEFRWMVNSEWRFAGSHVHGMADALLDQLSHADGVTTIEQRFDRVDAAGALYSANFALALVVPLADGLLGHRYSSEISKRLGEFTGHSGKVVQDG